jgi:DNA-binding response OmpR family regulator
MIIHMNLLLLEDNVAIASSLGEYLEAMDCTVDYAYSAKASLEMVQNNSYDVLVLDISMPGMTGLDACVEMRKVLQIATPVLFLTARDTLEDKLTGFASGADDYLVKPFSPEELFCRLQALHSRGPRRDIGIQVIGPLTINHSLHTVEREGSQISLANTQFRILALLAKNSPNVVTKEMMENAVWLDGAPDSDALRTHLYRLRNLIDKPFDRAMIKTVHGKGYRLEAH